MANANSTAEQEEEIKFARKGDLIDALDAKLSQLSSMLVFTYGCGGSAFRSYTDEIQDNYMWACSNLADECRELAVAIEAARPLIEWKCNCGRTIRANNG